MTGEDLHRLLLEKWGKSYDIHIRRTQGKIYVQIMWRYLEQVSFPLSPEEYQERLDAVMTYVQGWGATEQVVNYIRTTREHPRLGKVVSIPLELGDRASEWLLEEF